MKIFISFFFLFVALKGNSQKLYLCEYTDSINITNYEETIQQIRRSMEEKNVSPEIIDSYISNYFADKNSFLQVQSRIVDVYPDSSVITLKYIPRGNFQSSFQIPGNILLVKNSALFRYNKDSDTYFKSSLPDSSTTFTKNNSRKLILGFDCVEFQSLDHKYTIWIAEALPSSINPGIVAKNVPGAILGFEVKSGNGITKSILTKIEKPKVSI
jgi:hypothetical protein